MENNTGKKRKFNLVDLLIIVAVLAVIVLAVYKLGVVNKVQSSSIENEAKQMQYTVYMEGVRQPTVDAFHVGDKVYDDRTNAYMGDIVAIDVSPLMLTEAGPDGEFIQVEKIGYFCITLTLEGPILEKENGYYVSGVMELKINSEFPIYTKFARPSVRVSGIQFDTAS